MNERMQKFVLHLAGKPASGKSTFAHLISQKFPGTYTIFYDKLKWQLSGYEREQHRRLITDIELGLYEVVCRQGIPIVFELFFETEDEYLTARGQAEALGYVFLTIELVAPEAVLMERFRERL